MYRGEWIIGSLKDDRGHTSIGRRAFDLSIPAEIGDVPKKEESYWTSDYVNSVTVGQFTGLRDKNGKEIYEGDIVRIKTLQGIVTWHPNGYFCIHTYKCDISEVSYTAIGDMVDYFHKDFHADGLEVIGNIHDNPELIEGGEK